jgi:hypothetical protein
LLKALALQLRYLPSAPEAQRTVEAAGGEQAP